MNIDRKQHTSRPRTPYQFRAICSAIATRSSVTSSAEKSGVLRRVQELSGMPVEIEWALDGSGLQLLQARPFHTI